MDNQQFINGSWYDQEYLHGCYRKRYIDDPEPDWAKEAKRWCINRALIYTGLPLSAKILDLGSGTGQFMRAWNERGFKNVHGIEISQIAVFHSGIPTLRQGTVQDMSCFNDKEFDLIFSSALFEHIDDCILDDVLDECFRVGVMQVHTLCLQQGEDPSHINMKTENEWLKIFSDRTDDFCFIMPDTILNESPILHVIPFNKLQYPFRDKIFRYATADNNDK